MPQRSLLYTISALESKYFLVTMINEKKNNKVCKCFISNPMSAVNKCLVVCFESDHNMQ